MASNSHRRSGSSASSSRRKTVHVGTGTTSRKASVHPHTQVPRKESHRGATQATRDSKRDALGHADSGQRNGASKRASARPVSPKQAERRKKQAEQRRALQLRAAAVLGVLVALWALWAGLSGSQLFEIRQVDVVGNTRLSADEVIALARIASGETLLRIDGDEISENLTSDPWIAGADVSRRLPSTLRIEVQERTPAAVVDSGSTFWFVEEGGRVLAESIASSATVVPVIRDVPDFVAEPGTLSESDTLRNALRVLSGLSDELRSSVRTISAPTVEETALLTASGVEIMMGEAVNMPEKSVLVSDILKAQGANVVFIDVRSIERPISRGLND